MKITLNCLFKNPKGEQKSALLFLNRTSEETWYCRNYWIGKSISGDIEATSLLGPPEIYLKDGDGIIGLVKGVAIHDIMRDIGDTGTGKIYVGGMGRYPVPLDLNWEVVEAQGKSTIPANDRGPAD